MLTILHLFWNLPFYGSFGSHPSRLTNFQCRPLFTEKWSNSSHWHSKPSETELKPILPASSPVSHSLFPCITDGMGQPCLRYPHFSSALVRYCCGTNHWGFVAQSNNHLFSLWVSWGLADLGWVDLSYVFIWAWPFIVGWAQVCCVHSGTQAKRAAAIWRHLFLWWWQRHKRVSPIKQHIKVLLHSCLLMSHWPKHVTWQSPKSRSQEVYFVQHEAKTIHMAKPYLTAGSRKEGSEYFWTMI